jgi:hypothetical protein
MFNIKKSKALVLGNIGIFLMIIAGMCIVYEVACNYFFHQKEKNVATISLILSIGGLVLAPLRPNTSAKKISLKYRNDSTDECDISIWYQKNSKLIKTINPFDVTELQNSNDFTFDINTSMINGNLFFNVEANSQSFSIIAMLCQIDLKDGSNPTFQKESEYYGVIWHIGINFEEFERNNIKNFNFRFLVLASDAEKRVIEKFSKWYNYNVDSKTVLL